jgi:hypothetical protein
MFEGEYPARLILARDRGDNYGRQDFLALFLPVAKTDLSRVVTLKSGPLALRNETRRVQSPRPARTQEWERDT